jgi:hypothetical protein
MVVLLDAAFAKLFWKSEIIVASVGLVLFVLFLFFYVLGFLIVVFAALASRKPGLHPNGSLDVSA